MSFRVLYIDHTINKSGAAISLGALIKSLSSRVEPHFILRTNSEVEEIIGAVGKQTYFERFMPQFMTTLRTPQYSLILFVWHLAKIPMALVKVFFIIRKWRIHLIHLNETALLPYVFVGRLLRVPVVMHARGATAPRPVEHFFLRQIGYLKKVAIIAIDEETLLSFPVKCWKISHVIYNPVDLGPEPSPEEIRKMRESWGCSPNDILIGQVASLHTSKGIWEILEFAAKICPKYPKVRFALVGDDRPEGGEGPQLRRAIAARKLDGRVILTGYESELSAVYGALDIALCLFSQRLGGVGRAAYEAALAGRPLVATLPDPDSSQTVKNGLTGLVFKPADKEGILAALCSLIESETKRIEIGEKAKKEIGNRHLPSLVAKQVESLYSILISRDKLKS